MKGAAIASKMTMNPKKEYDILKSTPLNIVRKTPEPTIVPTA